MKLRNLSAAHAAFLQNSCKVPSEFQPALMHYWQPTVYIVNHPKSCPYSRQPFKRFLPAECNSRED